MKKRGFTLIELLAVIVVLAIIALIAVPVILNIIENARKASAIDSSYGYVKAVENYLIRKELKNEEKEIKVGENNVEDVTKVISVKGTKPTSGIIEINEKNVVTKGTNLCILGYSVQYEAGKESYISGKCNEEEKEEIIEDKVACELEKETIDGKEYYYVDSVCDLYALSKNVSSGTSYQNKIVKLRNNLDMSKIDNNTKKYIEENKDYFTEEELKINERFMPIGTSSKVFAGTFEGNTKTISNLTINRPTMDYVGLFGFNTGVIKGLTLSNINITGKDYIGGLAGASGGDVSEIIIKGNVEGTSNVGGIEGSRLFGYGSTSLRSAIVNVNVKGTTSVGGAVGYNNQTVTGIIIESGDIEGQTFRGTNKNVTNSYYSEKVNAVTVDNAGTKFDSNTSRNINAYEGAIDTYIGGDDDDSGYYFDYNSKGELVIKSTEKDPIEFKLKGSGTESDPYLIGSYEDWKMATIKADQVGVYFKLTKDIDFTGKPFYMLGSNQNQFSGHLDGDNHTISGIETKGGDNQGLIGYMTKLGTLKNLNIEGFKLEYGIKNVGSVIGYDYLGTVENLNVNNINITGNENVGGLFGFEAGKATGINANNIKVKGTNNVGGLAGASGGDVSEIIIRGNVEGTSNVGGIEGSRLFGYGSTSLRSAIVNVNVKGTTSVGGAVGYNNQTVTGIIIESGDIEGQTFRGTNKNVTNSYYSEKVNAVTVDNAGTKFDSNTSRNINAYEGAIDTYIGGDDDDSGYYFDYNSKGELVIKSTEKDPIEFKLKGSGTESDPYLIGSYEDWKMATIKADQVGVYFKLTKDIDFTGKPFYMLGSNQNQFSGHLDGDNHTISGIETKGGDNQGLIGYMTKLGTLKNLNIEGFKLEYGIKNVGSVIGYDYLGTVENLNVNNINITGNENVGGLFGFEAGKATGINANNIKVKGTNNVGGLAGASGGDVSEIIIRGNVEGTSNVGGIEGSRLFGYGSTSLRSAIVNVNVKGTTSVGGAAGYNKQTVTGIIIESGNIEGQTLCSYSNATNSYYSDKVVATYYYGTKYSSRYINDLTYYDELLDSSNNPIIESKYTGDVNGSGYFFDYGSDGKIKVVKAYTYDKGTANVDENYTMTKIVGTTDTTAPTCGLDYVIAVSNGIRASFSCTDESGTPEVSSLFDSTTSKSAEEFENIGTVKKGVVNGNKRSVITTWTTNDSVSKPTKGTCYYFRYGARDSSGNYSTYVTDKCYKGFN